MSTRKHSQRNRGFRPETDALETRQLLSAVVSGKDANGDSWTLRMLGPGQISVLKQNDLNGKPGTLDSLTDIQTITIGGTNPATSKLIGVVTSKGANSDGRVFFQNFNQLPARSLEFGTGGFGILSIDMPQFWLGNTTPLAQSTVTTPTAAQISIPDGTDTLRFGGVDTTHLRPPATSTTTSDVDQVTLGLPLYGGTRVVIDRAISSTQTFTTPASGTTPASTNTLQHGVTFAVAGRLDLFQANSIDGDAANPPGQFIPTTNTTTTRTAGGTVVFSGTAGNTQFLPSGSIKGQVTGQIGDVRIGGNATNFSTLVIDSTGSGNDRISNFSIGGETTNVLLIAPNGSRNVVFGKGMDTVQIASHVINTLQANRGALNSTVQVDRTISRINLGGDVVGTKILSGYQQNFTNIYDTVLGVSNSPFGGGTPNPIPAPIAAQPAGGMTVLVAGDVVNSVFAASTQPVNQVFGDPNQLELTGGRISAKVEGKINNSTLTPLAPNQAFYAQSVKLFSGPVVPPNVPEAPYVHNQAPSHLPGISDISRPPKTFSNRPTANVGASAKQHTLNFLRQPIVGQPTPQGPH